MRLADAPAAAGAPDKILVIRGGAVRSRELPAAAADLAPAGQLGPVWGRLLLVSPAGDDDDAAAGNPLRPYRTLEAAQAAAAAGDTVRPTHGDYAPALTLGKDGVNWRLPAGVTVTAPAGQPAFAAGPGVSYRLAGPGRVLADHAFGAALINGGSLALHGVELRQAGTGPAAQFDSGSLTLAGCGVLWTASGPCVAAAGPVTLHCTGPWAVRFPEAAGVTLSGVPLYEDDQLV